MWFGVQLVEILMNDFILIYNKHFFKLKHQWNISLWSHLFRIGIKLFLREADLLYNWRTTRVMKVILYLNQTTVKQEEKMQSR